MFPITYAVRNQAWLRLSRALRVIESTSTIHHYRRCGPGMMRTLDCATLIELQRLDSLDNPAYLSTIRQEVLHGSS